MEQTERRQTIPVRYIQNYGCWRKLSIGFNPKGDVI